jgi:hypothetical protein
VSGNSRPVSDVFSDMDPDDGWLDPDPTRIGMLPPTLRPTTEIPRDQLEELVRATRRLRLPTHERTVPR